MKSLFIPKYLLKKIQKFNRQGQSSAPICTWCRSSVIIPNMIGHTIAVYNGQKHIPVYIREQMVGHKLGEFSPSRYFRGHKKTDRKVVRQKR